MTGKHRPRSSEVNLLNFDQTLEYMRDNKIKNVVHCAARVGGVQENMDKLGEFFYENMQMTLNIIEASRLCGVEKWFACCPPASFQTRRHTH